MDGLSHGACGALFLLREQTCSGLDSLFGQMRCEAVETSFPRAEPAHLPMGNPPQGVGNLALNDLAERLLGRIDRRPCHRETGDESRNEREGRELLRQSTASGTAR